MIMPFHDQRRAGYTESAELMASCFALAQREFSSGRERPSYADNDDRLKIYNLGWFAAAAGLVMPIVIKDPNAAHPKWNGLMAALYYKKPL